MSSPAPRTEIRINVYELLPPGKLSSFLWTIGNDLLHSGIVIADKEYAFGAHGKRGVSGIYWTTPRQEPPAPSFRCELLHGYTSASPDEINEIILEASRKFLGHSWNLLTNNCNHFTSYLCMRFTKTPVPPWLNRAASFGIALPCVLPREWLNAPDVDTAEGELVDNEYDEETVILNKKRHYGHHRNSIDDYEERDEVGDFDDLTRPHTLMDSSGRFIPDSERAPIRE